MALTTGPGSKPKPAFRTVQTGELIEIEGMGYKLQISRQKPELELFLGQRHVATLNLASALDTTDAYDEQTVLGAPVVREEAEFVVVNWQGHSTRWAEKEVTLHAWEDGFAYGYTVNGQGFIDRANFWRDHWNGSKAHSVRLFNPEPNSERVRFTGERCLPDKNCDVCNPKEGARQKPDFMTISVGRDKNYHSGNWLFTPAPFCYALEGAENWLSMGIAASKGQWNFSDYLYDGDGFGFSLVYDGHVAVNGRWQSPLMLCLTASDEYAAIERYCEALRALEFTPDQGRGPAQEWWREPIFCGWGEQVSQEVHHGHPKAQAWATQSNYQGWLRSLEEQDLHPGTVVLDDKWQLHYGTNELDEAKWPDLPGFIAGQHDRGRRVLLWLKAWDPEGVPPEECIVDEKGQPVEVDPTNPAFRQRFNMQVHRMLAEWGADGFKVDFTHLIPRGPSLEQAGALRQRNLKAGEPYRLGSGEAVKSPAEGKWGLELLREWLLLLSEAAQSAKPGAVIIAHAANPYLADLVDILRLNDVAGLPDPSASIVPDMWHRVRIARAASPYWLLDADNWPCSSREQLRDYITAQKDGRFGIPSLYHARRLGWGKVDQALSEEDYQAIRECWDTYRQANGGPATRPEIKDPHPVKKFIWQKI